MPTGWSRLAGFLASRALVKQWTAKFGRKLGVLMEEVSRSVEQALSRGEPGSPEPQANEGPDKPTEPEA